MTSKRERNFVFLNRRTGKAMTASGMTVVQAEPDGSPAQVWRTIPAAGTTVRILHPATGKYLSVLGEPEDGKGFCLADPIGSVEQIWKVTAVSRGIRKITHVHSGKVADIRGLSDADGAAVQLWTYVHGENQEWIAKELPPEQKAGDGVGFSRAVSDALPCAKY